VRTAHKRFRSATLKETKWGVSGKATRFLYLQPTNDDPKQRFATIN